MSETPTGGGGNAGAESPAQPLASTNSGHAVYDAAELRFVTGPLARTEAQSQARKLNDGNDVKPADGKGARYKVREV